MRRPPLLIVALVVFASALGAPATSAVEARHGVPAMTAASVRAGAMPDHFGIGLSAQPAEPNLTGWMPGTGIAWDFAYQYLSGGVNTGHSWQTWIQDGRYPAVVRAERPPARVHPGVPVLHAGPVARTL